jgi:energy-coupling factor transporter ATP-binding protein EcfA2
LLYPLDQEDLRQTVFVGVVNKYSFDKESIDGQWVKARVELSPAKERDKHKNPFALKATNGGIQLMQKIPKEFSESEIFIDGESHVEKWVVDFYRNQYRDQISKDGNELLEKINQEREAEERKVRLLQDESESLGEKIAQNERSLSDVSEKLQETIELQRKTETEFEQKKTKMEHQLDTLIKFIETKAKILIELDLLGQKDVDGLLGKDSSESMRLGHDFSKEFSADVTKAIGYLQAYLHQKGVVYRRKVLEDFFALLSTHDLIILAGDSGSGKTNLVKSFAEAVGGVSIIIPVKPNWTSAEDLLGYYNPLEQKYLSTRFLDALFEAAKNPDVPYLICLDEMNLARVEYYFADFLSLMEERGSAPEIHLYSTSESDHLVSEARNFLALIDDVKERVDKSDVVTFLDVLRDESINAKLHEMCGFREGESLLKYHVRLRKLLSSYLNTPSSISLPPNVRIIGAINVDETTHYLSPKILDRAHIMRFGSPLLMDWEQAEGEIETFDLDLKLPIKLSAAELGKRTDYPAFDRNNPIVETLMYLAREYLEPLGIEFGLRTIRQSRLYSTALEQLGADENLILNNIVLHKILPKLMFDGEKVVNDRVARKDLLVGMRDFLDERLTVLKDNQAIDYCIDELDRVIRNAESNDWIVNYWSR